MNLHNQFKQMTLNVLNPEPFNIDEFLKKIKTEDDTLHILRLLKKNIFVKVKWERLKDYGDINKCTIYYLQGNLPEQCSFSFLFKYHDILKF